VFFINKKLLLTTVSSVMNTASVSSSGKNLLMITTTAGIVIGKLAGEQEKTPLVTSTVLVMKKEHNLSTDDFIIFSDATIYLNGLKGDTIKTNDYLVFVDKIVGFTVVDNSILNF
jgi:hypothetical protein